MEEDADKVVDIGTGMVNNGTGDVRGVDEDGEIEEELDIIILIYIKFIRERKIWFMFRSLRLLPPSEKGCSKIL